MSVIVGTDSYGTEDGLTAYATARGVTITLPTGSTQTLAEYKTTLLIKCMDYLESRSFIGTKTVYNQALQFPRVLCDSYYSNYDYFSSYPQMCPYDSATVPTEIIKAQYIGAMLIYQGYDLQSTLGQNIKSEKVASLETVYQDYTSGAEQHRALDDILRPFLQSGVRVVRT